MQRFLLKTFLALVLLTVVAFTVDAWLAWRSLGKQYERYADFNVIKAGKSEADILIVGNSRARYHFDTRAISERTGLSCYNLGMIGYPIVEQLGKLEYHLKHSRAPKAIIFNLDQDSWSDLSRDTIGQYEQFLDVISDRIVLGMVEDKVGFRRADVLPWARFAGYPGYVWKIAINDTMTNCFGGFVADPTVMPDLALKQVVSPYHHEPGQFNQYLQVIREHRRKHWPDAQVLFVESIYFQRDTTPILDELRRTQAASFGSAVPVDLSWVHDTTYFMNRTHLNERGAAHYSQVLGDSLMVRLRSVE